jgi:hypothetical protein
MECAPVFDTVIVVQPKRTGTASPPPFSCREKDLDEVLQISNVFLNVSKGEVAKSNDLKKSFGSDDRNAITREVHVIPSSSSWSPRAQAPVLS